MRRTAKSRLNRLEETDRRYAFREEDSLPDGIAGQIDLFDLPQDVSQNYNFDEIYDVLAVRIITKTEMNCYEILGIIHATYKPIPGRFKDYIAMPKPNMYQSLHTSIVSGDGNIYEVQIRTEEMDQIAETGIAAHWRYKEGEHYNAKEEQRTSRKTALVPRFRLACRANESEEAKDYMAALSNDIFNANVYVFTPLRQGHRPPDGRDHPRFRLQDSHQSRRFGGRGDREWQ
jgi:(p)ppGpp synthase/HD superfamily hydrolase